MPRKRKQLTRSTLSRDIEALRSVIIPGIPWQPREFHYELTRNRLTLEQRALLGHLTPFKTAARSLFEFDPQVIETVKKALQSEILLAQGDAGAKGNGNGPVKPRLSILGQLRANF